ncbi:hypothetical protein SBA2_860014 [Acidobacteriia bacterium SbA2]|nr:hypothetical protein SBA2_860014 [Acidobacteriia bacterium SbA2]
MIAYIRMLGCRPEVRSSSVWTPHFEVPNGQFGIASRRGSPCGLTRRADLQVSTAGEIGQSADLKVGATRNAGTKRECL